LLILPAWVGITLFSAVCGAAMWKGGAPERLTAAWLVLGWAATLLLRDPRWPHLQWGTLTIDVAFFVFLLVLALRTDRFWPIFAAGFQFLAVLTHLARLLDREMGSWVYLTADIIWTYLILFALAVGAWGCWRARAVGEWASERRAVSEDG
jgi:hypothetical protein